MRDALFNYLGPDNVDSSEIRILDKMEWTTGPEDELTLNEEPTVGIRMIWKR